MERIKKLFKNIIHYIVGNIRFFWFKNFKRKKINKEWEDLNYNSDHGHTVEQFLFRMFIVNLISPKCIEENACVICKCDTPELFFANKACEGGCYPKMMDEKTWKIYKKENKIDMIHIYNDIKHLV